MSFLIEIALKLKIQSQFSIQILRGFSERVGRDI